MHEERKLKEAWVYLGEMHAHERDPSAFIHLLSSFLSAGRSVAQYAHEATAKPDGQAWYDAGVGKCPLIASFKTERDVNIPTKPVDPKAVWKVAGSVPLFISGGADYGVKFLNAKGSRSRSSPRPHRSPLSHTRRSRSRRSATSSPTGRTRTS